MDEHYAWLAWSLLPGMNWQKAQKLLTLFPGLKTAWEEGTEKAFKELGLNSSFWGALEKARAEKDWEKMVLELGKKNLGFITYPDEDYPLRLREISGPPLLLYFWGGLKEEPGASVAVIGSRTPTHYGLGVARELALVLAQGGVGVISGLAYGIDGEAHRGTVEAGGKGIGVTGSGLDKASFYPSVNFRLAEKIVALGGVIFSEYPPGTPALPHHFPERNRIIAGISSAVVVVEAGDRSGALITAFLALEENRDVFAVPGRITEKNASGSNRLLKLGAIPLTSTLEILEHLGIPTAISPQAKLATDFVEEKILEFLASDARHIDEILRELSLSAPLALSKLTLMELRGLVRSRAGGYYSRV